MALLPPPSLTSVKSTPCPPKILPERVVMYKCDITEAYAALTSISVCLQACLFKPSLNKAMSK